MTGREERQKKVENRIMKKLEKFKKENTKIVNGKEVYPNYMDQFYNTVCNRGRDELGTSMNTRYLYICAVVNFLNYLKENNYNIMSAGNFKEIRKSEIEGYIITLRERKRNRGNTSTNSGSYLATQIHAIKAFFEFLYGDGYIKTDPAFGIKIPKANKDLEIITLTDNEIQEVTKIIKSGILERGGQWKERDMAIFMLGLRTGMRISEIVELNVEDIDFEEKEIIVVGKGNKKRTICLTDSMSNDLQSWIELRKEILYNVKQSCNALFISSHCTRLSDAAARNMIERYTEVAGHKISPHKLRATFATLLLNSTDNIQTVADCLGHSEVSTTKRYAKVSKTKVKEAFEIIRF